MPLADNGGRSGDRPTDREDVTRWSASCLSTWRRLARFTLDRPLRETAPDLRLEMIVTPCLRCDGCCGSNSQRNHGTWVHRSARRSCVEAAHAVDSEHWEQPLLASDLAKAYLVSDRRAMLETNCNICHRNDRETKGAGYINYGKELVRSKGCRACHTINNRGGIIGPNLTSYIGDLNSEQYNYQRMPGKPSVFGWHLAHFKDPKAMSSETVMPNFGSAAR